MLAATSLLCWWATPMNCYSRAAGLHIMRARNTVCNLRVSQPLTGVKSQFCASSAEPSYHVIHDREKRRFTVRLDDRAGPWDCAVLQYSYKTDRHVQLVSTAVPQAFRGRGVASHLAKAALDFVVEEKLKATISCWYIRKYVDENPLHGCQAYIVD